MAIIRVAPEAEERKKNDAPKDWDVGDYDDATIAKAVATITQLPGTPANDNYVQVPWPVVLTAIPAAALDFGNVSQIKPKLSDLVASQTLVKRDRLLWHAQNPGKRSDAASPFVSMPIVTEDGIIIDGHHALSALFYLAGPGLSVPLWFIPLGLATGHPRGM